MDELAAAGAAAEPYRGPARWLVPEAYLFHPNRSRARRAEAVRALRAVAGLTCAEAYLAEGQRLPVGQRIGERVETPGARAAIAARMLAPNGVVDYLDTLLIDSWRRDDA